MATYPSEAWPSSSVVQLLDGTTHQATGLPYIAKGTGPTSDPSYEEQYNRRQARLNSILASCRQGMVVDEGDLDIGVYPVEYTIGGVRKSFTGSSGVSMTDDSTKVVYLDSSATLQTADSWPTDVTTFLPLAQVVAADGSLTITDKRVLTVFHVPSPDRRIITAHKSSVTSSQADVEVFEFDPSENLTLEEVQVYCTAVVATASVDVKEGGTTVLSSAATPAAGLVVKPTISDGSIASANNVTVHVTTDGSGSITDLTVMLVFAAAWSGS